MATLTSSALICRPQSAMKHIRRTKKNVRRANKARPAAAPPPIYPPPAPLTPLTPPKPPRTSRTLNRPRWKSLTTSMLQCSVSIFFITLTVRSFAHVVLLTTMSEPCKPQHREGIDKNKMPDDSTTRASFLLHRAANVLLFHDSVVCGLSGKLSESEQPLPTQKISVHQDDAHKVRVALSMGAKDKQTAKPQPKPQLKGSRPAAKPQTPFLTKNLPRTLGNSTLPWNQASSALTQPSTHPWCMPRFSKESVVTYPPRGLLYVKVHKTSSSTAGGVALRIANRVYNRRKQALINKALPKFKQKARAATSCEIKFTHRTAREGKYADRLREGDRRGSSYLWSIVRDPTKRVVSHYTYWHVSVNGNNATDENLKAFLESETPQQSFPFGPVPPGGYQTQYLTTDTKLNNHRLKNLKDAGYLDHVVSEILHEYDFLGVSERLEESLVALRLLMGLQAGDVAFLSAKNGPGYAYTPKCIFINKSNVSPAMKAYFETPEWKQRNRADYALYEAADKKLDATIELIGRKRFDEALKEHRQLLEKVNEKCTEGTVFPCDPVTGEERWDESQKNCYRRDMGCGFPCIDNVVSQN